MERIECIDMIFLFFPLFLMERVRERFLFSFFLFLGGEDKGEVSLEPLTPRILEPSF